MTLPSEDSNKAALIKSIQNLEEVLLRLEKMKSMSEEKIASLGKLRSKIAEIRGRLELSDASFFAPEPIPVPVVPVQGPVKKKL